MNMNTINQELNKKIKMMSINDFIEYVHELCRIWEKTHKKELGDAFSIYLERVRSDAY